MDRSPEDGLRIVTPLTGGVPDDQILEQLERMLASGVFGRSDRHRRFLRFLVQQVLDGKSHELTEARVALEVFNRKNNFDSAIDPIVRVEAGRLRRRLREYYDTEGTSDAIEIELPARTYVPVFRPRMTPVSPDGDSSRRDWKRALLTIALPMLAVVGIGAAAIGFSGASSHDANAALASNLPAVVVLPVLDLSPGPDDEALCDTLTEELIDELANTAGWRVVSRTSAFQYKGKSIDVRRIGKDLNAQLVVEGSIRRQGDKLHVSLNLVSADDGYNIWTRKYTLSTAQIGSFEHDLATEAAKAMRQQVWRGH